MFRSLFRRNFITFIQESETGVLQTFGKLGGIRSSNSNLLSGIRFYVPFVQSVTHVSNRRTQQKYPIICRTLDGVSVKLVVCVQATIESRNSSLALFSLHDPIEQIGSTVNDQLRSSIASVNIDELFSQQNQISDIVMKRLEEYNSSGYTFNSILVSDIEPDQEVKKSMNRVNASLREKQVAEQNAQAHYITVVKDAEAQSKKMELQGKGISLQRNAILAGYSDYVVKMADILSISPEKLLKFTTDMQYIDMQREIGQSNNTKTIFIPNDNDRSKLNYMSANDAINSDKNTSVNKSVNTE